MRASRNLSSLRKLRRAPLWKLLAADKAPCVVALLQELLMDTDKVLPAGVLYERLGQALTELRAAGEDLPQPPQAYAADWLSQGWLTRRLPAGASEEVFELSADAASAIRYIASLTQRRSLATESRLSTVIQQVLKLAEATDGDPDSRVIALLAERERIDRELDSVRAHGVTVLPPLRALERAREIIALADELAGDFRRVRDDFDRLNRGLRQSLMEHEGSRGEVLEALFAGVDLIGESPAGKTFSAFWRLLTDPEQSEALREALEAIAQRPFARELEARERKFLVNLTNLLADEGGSVHEVLQSFARSLKSFVQSREFLEQRRLHTLLKQATHAALEARNFLRPTQELDYDLTLTSSRVRSVAQWVLYDPAGRVGDAHMSDSEASELDLAHLSELVRLSDIDFRTLREHVRSVLDKQAQASISQILSEYPAEQGLGSVIGYVALGVKHGERTQDTELVSWRGHDAQLRRARVPTVYFVRERYGELVE
jgi:hypothetical protein